jgi:isopenicillin N synthase-like dioxygenase
MSIPVIDFAGALAPGGLRSQEVADQFRQASMVSGFFYMRGHEVAPGLLEAQFATAKALMSVPDSVKRALSIQNSPIMRGYENIGEQTLDEHAKPDLKESFYCGMAIAPDHPYVLAGYQTYGPNQWPSEVPHAPQQCENYIQAMLVLCRRIMQIMALSLDLPEGYFDTTGLDPMVTLRMLRYPPHPADADDRTFGAGAHTDWGALTILAQDDCGGLEVQMPDGQWVDAPPIEGCFIVNLGDMIPRWTNGRYHSNPHRVRNRSAGLRERYSIPFFYEPNYMARIEPVPGTVAPGEAPKYAPCTSGEHLREMYLKTYGALAKGIA